MHKLLGSLISFLLMGMPIYAQLNTSGNDEFITVFIPGYSEGDNSVNVLPVVGTGDNASFYDEGSDQFESIDDLTSQGWWNIFQYRFVVKRSNL
jgi:hypothetical protein